MNLESTVPFSLKEPLSIFELTVLVSEKNIDKLTVPYPPKNQLAETKLTIITKVKLDPSVSGAVYF